MKQTNKQTSAERKDKNEAIGKQKKSKTIAITIEKRKTQLFVDDVYS